MENDDCSSELDESEALTSINQRGVCASKREQLGLCARIFISKEIPSA